MAVKSILQIDVDDSRFQTYLKAFKKYEDGVKALPKAWKEVSQLAAAGTISKEASAVAQGVLVANDALTKQAREEERITRLTQDRANKWREISREAKVFSGAIVTATTSILKWGSITGLLSGLLGIGSLWGLERLAAAAGGQRRSASGLGIGIGEQSAFQTSLGRLVDPDQFLAHVSKGLGDVRERYALMGADAAGGGTGGIAIELLRRMKALADNTNEALLGPVFESRGLPGSVEDWRRLKGTSRPEFEGQLDQYRTLSDRLNLTQQQAKAWQDLQVILTASGKSIERTFITGLAPLATPLGTLSESVTKVVAAFFDAAQKRGWIDTLSTKLNEFAGYIGDPKFETDVKEFVRNVGEMAEAAGSAAKWIASWFPSKGKLSENYNPQALAFNDAFGSALPSPYAATFGGIGKSIGGFFGGLASTPGYDIAGQPLSRITTAGGHSVTVGTAGANRFKGFLEALEASGAPITSLGGYNPRKIAGTSQWSEHAFGRAIDVDQSGRDVVTKEFREWARAHFQELQAAERQYGIKSGGDFRHPDFGHFELKPVTVILQTEAGSSSIIAGHQVAIP